MVLLSFLCSFSASGQTIRIDLPELTDTADDFTHVTVLKIKPETALIIPSADTSKCRYFAHRPESGWAIAIFQQLRGVQVR